MRGRVIYNVWRFWTGFISVKIGTDADICEYGNQILDSIKRCCVLKEDPATVVYSVSCFVITYSYTRMIRI
jgi:hypothetical protein